MWRAAVATATARRNKGAWSSLGLGLSLGDSLGDILSDSLCEILGDTLGDILAKYGASMREKCSCNCCSYVWYLFYGYGDSLSCALPLEKVCSPCLVLLLQLDGVFWFHLVLLLQLGFICWF